VRVNLPWVGGLEVKRLSPEKSDDLVSELNQLVTDAEESLSSRHVDWTKYDEYYSGVQAINKDVDTDEKDNRDRKCINFCMPTIESMVPILNDAAPAWYAIHEGMVESAGEEGDTFRADSGQKVTGYLQGYWHYARVEHEMEKVYRDMCIYGTGVVKVYWDKLLRPVASVEDDDGELEGIDIEGLEMLSIDDEDEPESLGEVAVEWCDPYSVYPDPNARVFEECRYIALKVEMSKEDAQRQFPGLQEDDMATVSELRPKRIRPDEQNNYRDQLVEVWEVYHEFGERLTIYTGKKILFDGENPTPNKQFPVVFYANRQRGGTFWGMSEIANLINTQDFLNLVNWRIARHQRFCGNPQKKTNDASITEVTNEPGKIYLVRARVAGETEGYLENIDPSPLDAQVFAWLSWLEASFDTQSGVHEVTQGVRPKGVTSGIALGILSEAAQSRLRLMIRSASLSIEDMGQLVLGYMQDNYVETRSVSFFGNDKPETATLESDVLGGGLGRVATYRVIVQSRGDLPLNPAAQLDIGIQLAQAGFIDQIEVLKIANWPDADAIVQRMQMAQQQQMMGQMQAMMAQQGGGGGAVQE